MPIVFMDTETTGLSPSDHIWEWAAVRREDDGRESTFHCFLRHNQALAEKLPEPFRTDHDTRYDDDAALTVREFIGVLKVALAGRPHIIGAVPNFDTERLAILLDHYGIDPLWHYHLRDIENLAIGHLLGQRSKDRLHRHDGSLPDAWNDSETLSRIIGVDPALFARHTALGDVQWTRAIYDALTGRTVPHRAPAAVSDGR